MADHPSKAVPRSERCPRVLHLSADFPDPINPAKTPVIARLIDLVADAHDHRVISLNRRSPTLAATARIAAGLISPIDEASLRPITHGVCAEYLAPPKGLLHSTMLQRLANWVTDHVTRHDAIPDLVVGHKLTVEGIVARKVAQNLGRPFAITIQGNTDEKILRARPDLQRQFARIYHEAACVFSFAPWARRSVELRLGERHALTLDLPCPTLLDSVRSPVPGGDALISVFHLRNYETKNLAGLTRAMRALAAAGSGAKLQIIGDGSPGETAACQAIIGTTPNTALAGPCNGEELATVMNKAIAMVMPSRRESFGLVFVEALFAGLPIIYPKGASVDGYFDGLPFAIGVDAQDSGAIADAIRHVIAHEASIKAALARWQEGGGLERFSRKSIGLAFDEGLKAAIGPPSG